MDKNNPRISLNLSPDLVSLTPAAAAESLSTPILASSGYICWTHLVLAHLSSSIASLIRCHLKCDKVLALTALVHGQLQLFCFSSCCCGCHASTTTACCSGVRCSATTKQNDPATTLLRLLLLPPALCQRGEFSRRRSRFFIYAAPFRIRISFPHFSQFHFCILRSLLLFLLAVFFLVFL